MTNAGHDAHDLAALVRSGEVSPLELVDAAIERIERINPEINAVIHPRFEAARAAAAEPSGDGPFAGVPFLVKDLGCTIAGEPHTRGCQGLVDRDARGTIDSALYERFTEAGLITLGRTNTPEFGSTITTEPVAFGPSRNPWNLDYSTGGSSGGSAAAVAAGLVPMAHASDGGGSIRVPSSECGLVGLKPSRGRISRAPDGGEAWAGGTTDGVVTRSVRDSAAALDVMAGYEPGDPYTAPPPLRPFADEVGAAVESLKVGFVSNVEGSTVHPDCVTAVASATALLESLGHSVDEAHPASLSDDDFQRNFLTIVAAYTAEDVDAMGEQLG
jgi:amidase